MYAGICSWKRGNLRFLCQTGMRKKGYERGNRFNLLALSDFRFERDINHLEQNGPFNFLRISWRLQAGLVSRDSWLKTRLGIDSTLKIFLRHFCRFNNIDAVIGTALWYSQDIPWGRAAEELGIPYIVLHKECFKPSILQTSEEIRKLQERVGYFAGSLVIVHNEPTRRKFIDHGIVDSKLIRSEGCMRMDSLVMSRNRAFGFRGAKTITLFSFTHPAFSFERTGPFPENPYLGFIRLFSRVHVAIAQLAEENPDYSVRIKAKWGGEAYKQVALALAAADIDIDSIQNLVFTSDCDAHELIRKSDVICRFQSTTLLEAGICGKFIVVPDFDETTYPEYRQRIKLPESYENYEVAHSPMELKEKIVAAVEHGYSIDRKQMQRREAYFSEWVSDLEGVATRQYVSAIAECIEKRSSVD